MTARVSLSFASILANDVLALSGFYRELFELAPVSSLDSPHFRGLLIGSDTVLGFSAFSAYEMLNLDIPESAGVRTFLTFEAKSAAEVEALTTQAVTLGATVRRGPAPTYYHAYQATLLDPEGNAFRINFLEIAEVGMVAGLGT